MALINCPECGKQVSSAAISCPNCGYAISANAGDVVRIKIDSHPTVFGYNMTILNYADHGYPISCVAGNIVEIPTTKPIEIGFRSGLFGEDLRVTVSPANGGKYKATWGAGLLTAKITGCNKVDVL